MTNLRKAFVVVTALAISAAHAETWNGKTVHYRVVRFGHGNQYLSEPLVLTHSTRFECHADTRIKPTATISSLFILRDFSGKVFNLNHCIVPTGGLITGAVVSSSGPTRGILIENGTFIQ